MQDNKKTSKSNTLKLTALYAVFALIILICSVFLFRGRVSFSNDNNITISSDILQTEYVYVMREDTASSSSDTASDDVESVNKKYIVREYMGKIGVFSEDGALVQTIDVYVKTLPEADKRLLGEGIEIVGKDALNSIIEDYSV